MATLTLLDKLCEVAQNSFFKVLKDFVFGCFFFLTFAIQRGKKTPERSGSEQKSKRVTNFNTYNHE